MEIHHISRIRYLTTILWALLVCTLIVATIALLARGTLNLNAALTEKPDIALYLLLPEEEITDEEVLRESEKERDYLVQTKDGPKLVKLRKGEEEWYVQKIENLHE